MRHSISPGCVKIEVEEVTVRISDYVYSVNDEIVVVSFK